MKNILSLCANHGHSHLNFLAAFLAVICLLGTNFVFADDSAPFEFEIARQAASRLPKLNSLLISHKQELLVEDYFNGWEPSRPANMKSASKSVISALVGIAIADGLIPAVETPIGKYFDEYLEGDNKLSRGAITVEDLLTMRSGLETTSNRNYGKWVLSDNWVEFALNQPLVAEPGTSMLYSTGSTHLLSAIITQASGQTTKRFAQENLASKLGFSLSYWSQDPQGIYFGGNNLEITARQMLSFGELYLNKGRAGETQILTEQWVEESFRPRATSPRGQGRFYGYGWWLRDLAGLQVPVAWGYGGQLIFVVRELDLVVVATSDSEPSPNRRSHLRRLYDLVEEDIIMPLRTRAAE